MSLTPKQRSPRDLPCDKELRWSAGRTTQISKLNFLFHVASLCISRCIFRSAPLFVYPWFSFRCYPCITVCSPPSVFTLSLKQAFFCVFCVFCGFLGEQRRKRSDRTRETRVAREGRSAKKLTAPLARDSRFALASLSPLFA